MKTSAIKIISLCHFFCLAFFMTLSAQHNLTAKEGPFKPTDESLRQYQYPEWFRDAKLGFWAHWGPQAVPRQGDWYYRTGQKYKTAEAIIQMLVDIVSKNGNLLINIVQTPEGDLEPDMLQILDSIGV